MLIILIILVCVYFGFKYGFSEIKTDSKEQEKLKEIPVKTEDSEIDEAKIISGHMNAYSDFMNSPPNCSGLDSHSCECHSIDSHNCDL